MQLVCWVISILRKSNLFPSHKFDFPFGKNLATLRLITDPSFLSLWAQPRNRPNFPTHLPPPDCTYVQIFNQYSGQIFNWSKIKTKRSGVGIHWCLGFFPHVIDRSLFRGLLDLEPVGKWIKSRGVSVL